MERSPRDPANWIAPAAVAALFLVRFAPFLVGGTLYSRDAGFFFAPWRALLPKLSASGFPFWNDLLSNGRAALALAGGAALLSFGRFLPGYPVFARRLPIFRYPEKWWVVATLALSMAAAVGLGRLLAMDQDERDKALRILRSASLALVAPLGAVALLAFLSPRALRTVLWEASLGTGPAPASLVSYVLWPLALGGAAAMLVAAFFSELVRRGRAPRSALVLILSVLFLADGARRVAGTLPAGPPGLFSTRTPDVARVAEESMRGRFFDDRADDRATGRPLPLFRCDGYLTAAFVPPGEHRIDFAYDAGPFLRGGVVSALSLAVAALCVFLGRTP